MKLLQIAILTSILVLISSFKTFCQFDSLISVYDLNLHSEFEKEVLEGIINENSEDYLALYLAIDSTISWEDYGRIKESIQNKTRLYCLPSFTKFKDKKKINKIYSGVHDQFLVLYDDKALFSETVENGHYQCVSGTMLYALILNELQIPFDIKLFPNHVNLIAYPETEYFILETTAPAQGTVVFNQQFKDHYVKYLFENKLISQQEFEMNSTEQLFDKYFNESEKINMKQLASAQYSNMALDYLQNLKFRRAYELMEKAYLLNPSKKNTYMLFVMLAAALEQIQISSEEFAQYFGKYIRFRDLVQNDDELLALFAQMTFKQLEYEGNVERYDSSYNKVISNVSDSALKMEMNFIYNFERGRKLYNRGDYQAAKEFAEKAYSIKPRQSDAEMMFLSILGDRIEKGVYNKEEEKIIEMLKNYLVEYPQLNKNLNYKTEMLLVYLRLIDKFYYDGNVQKGEKYRIEFEEFYPASEYEFAKVNMDIVHSYNTAASYYFGKGKLKKCREMLDAGLHYVPNNQLLLQRLNMVK